MCSEVKTEVSFTKMPKRDLSPDSRSKNVPPLQQQKSISDIIGPMVDQCHLDLQNNESLASLASQNAAAHQHKQDSSSSGQVATGQVVEESPSQDSSAALKRNSTGSSRQDSSDGEMLYSMESDPSDPSSNTDHDVTDLLLDDGYTDADGLLGDAARAGLKMSKKAVKAAAQDIEDVVHGTWDVVEGAAKDIEDVVDSGMDVFGAGLNATTGTLKKCVTVQPSEEEKPDNNVYLSHPTEGAARMVPMGMHIQPFSNKRGSGHMILMVDPGKLAEQAHLTESDVIIKIGEKDVTTASLEEVLHIFGTISTKFSMTIVHRVQPIEGLDFPVLCKKKITVEVHVDDDNVVAIKLLEVSCSRLEMRGNPPTVCIYHQPNSDPNSCRYLRVSNNTLAMVTSLNHECHFHMNMFSPPCLPIGGNYHVNPFTFHNVSCRKAIKLEEESDSYKIDLGDTNDLEPGDTVDADLRFFLVHYPNGGGAGADILLESSKQPGHFLTCENESLRVVRQTYTSLDDLRQADSKFIFKWAYPSQQQQQQQHQQQQSS